MKRRRIGILTGGGDVPPLNAVLAAARRACLERDMELVGFLKGGLGVLENHYVNLADVPINPAIGGTILRSSRISLSGKDAIIARIEANLEDLELTGLIVIGGEDTLSNSFCLPGFPQVLISKTCDNDVGTIGNGTVTNYFTLGYPTAGKKISTFVSLEDGLRTTAYSHERLIVVESMGMHAGWLALASSMGHPDFIVVPEFPIHYETFLELVRERYERRRHAIIVIAEGARWADGSYISADENERDEFGHPRFKGAAETLAKRLKHDLKRYFDTRNVNAVNPSYLYRSGTPVATDLLWGQNLGELAVKLLSEGLEEPVLLSITRENGGFGSTFLPLRNYRGIDDLHRFVDARLYRPGDYCISPEGADYLSAIVPGLPDNADYPCFS
jgi:6-phosphofructokinase 1